MLSGFFLPHCFVHMEALTHSWWLLLWHLVIVDDHTARCIYSLRFSIFNISFSRFIISAFMPFVISWSRPCWPLGSSLWLLDSSMLSMCLGWVEWHVDSFGIMTKLLLPLSVIVLQSLEEVWLLVLLSYMDYEIINNNLPRLRLESMSFTKDTSSNRHWDLD